MNEAGMAHVYNFVAHGDGDVPGKVVFVDVTSLTDADARELIPQQPVAQSLYSLMRVQGFSIVEVLTEILKIQLASGGQRKFIHVRDGGRG